jgi:hypothetical protein
MQRAIKATEIYQKLAIQLATPETLNSIAPRYPVYIAARNCPKSI